jgi:fatty acid desaturase
MPKIIVNVAAFGALIAVATPIYIGGLIFVVVGWVCHFWLWFTSSSHRRNYKLTGAARRMRFGRIVTT